MAKGSLQPHWASLIHAWQWQALAPSTKIKVDHAVQKEEGETEAASSWIHIFHKSNFKEWHVPGHTQITSPLWLKFMK